ncbi:MAG TPA: NAD-dependent epimerase/dehydratase family protein [Candidatus Bathyarchaeia archaeon]|nr:NAD-dependent epimerase/dehydratase family protein [Candidatus Bathyarchaeia archaeon]
MTNPRRVLITGAVGQIGSELVTELRSKYGNDDVMAVDKRQPSETLRNSGPFEIADTSEKEQLASIIEKRDVGIVYHLASLLSVVGEKHPQLAWRVNTEGLCNVLDLARERGIQVFWPSSIAVFGPDVPRVNTPQNTITIPSTIYGVSKVAGELLCNYYFLRYGVDVRSLRYPGIISSETPSSGAGTTDYAVEMFYEALKKKKYTCFLRGDTVLPMMYMPDCIKATLDLMSAEQTRVKRRTSYNLTAMSFAPKELAAKISEHMPEFRCEYAPDFRQKIADSWPMSIDDSEARKDWGWQPAYDLSAMTEDMLKKLSKKFEAGLLS